MNERITCPYCGGEMRTASLICGGGVIKDYCTCEKREA